MPSLCSTKLDECSGPATSDAVSVSLSASESFASTLEPSSVESSAVVSASSLATGASFTELTVIVTVAVFESTWPSFAL